jgi:protein O-mannosyl-transferase
MKQLKKTNSDNSRFWIIGILVTILLVYVQSLFNGFTNWDDIEQVTANPDITALSLHNLKIYFTSFYVGMYQPIATLSFALIHAAAGLKPWAYHLFGVLLHVCNVFLVFLFVRKISKNGSLSCFVATLFAIAPIQTEAVAWVSATSTLLFTFFMLLSLLQYLNFRESNKRSDYFLSLLFFLISLFSKSAAVILPLLLILFDYKWDGKIVYKKLLNKIPFLLLSVVFGIITIIARQESGHIVAITNYFSVFNRIFLVLYSLVFYTISSLLPLKLSAFHPYPTQVAGTLPFFYYLTPLLIAGFIILVIRARQNKKEYIFGFLFFLLNLIVMLELIPVGVQVVKERYVYLASVGLFYNFGILFFSILSKKPKFKNRFIIAGALLFVVFSLITSIRIHTWKDSFTLWNNVISKYPKTSAAYINRGNAHTINNNFEMAIQDYSSAIAYEPKAADAYTNRAIAFSKQGNINDAIKDYNSAIAISPQNADMYAERAALKSGINDIEGAGEDLTKAISLKPKDETLYNKRGVLMGMAGFSEKALTDFNKAIALNSKYADAYSNRGYLYLNTGRYSEAITDLDKSLALNPESAKTFYIRGLAYIASGDTLKACNDFTSANQLGMDGAADIKSKYCR